MTDNPLTEPQIHAAIRALDAGDRPARATLRTALLMALAWHAAQAEIAGLRAQLHDASEDLHIHLTAYGTSISRDERRGLLHILDVLGGTKPDLLEMLERWSRD